MKNEVAIQIAAIFLVVLFGIISVLQGRKARHFSKRIAELQGVYKKTDFEMSIFKTSNINHFLIAAPFNNKKIFALPLQLVILNKGDKSSHKPELFIKMNKSLLFNDGVEYQLDDEGPKKVDLSVASKTENMHTLALSIEKDLRPRQSIIFNLPISIGHGTVFKGEAAATDKAGVDLTISYWADVSFLLDVILTQEDSAPISTRFTLSVIDSDRKSAGKFLNEYNESFVSTKQKNQPNTIKSFLSNFKKTKVDIPMICMLITFDESLTKKMDKYPIYSVMEAKIEKHYGFRSSKGYCIPSIKAGLHLLTKDNDTYLKQKGYELKSNKKS